MNEIIWQPVFPIPILLLVCLVCTTVVLFAFWRSGKGQWAKAFVLCVMRLCLVCLLTWILLDPSRVPEAVPEEIDESSVMILVDGSGSMLTEDMNNQTRWDFITENWLTPASIRALNEMGPVAVRVFDRDVYSENVATLLAKGTDRTFGGETQLVYALDQVLDERINLRHVLLLSDGRDSQDAHPAGLIARAKEKGIQIHTVPIGGPRLEKDLHVVGVLQQPYLIAGEEGLLRVRVMHANAQGELTTLHVTHQGKTRSYPIRFTDEAFVNVDLPLLHQEPGSQTYLLQVDPLPGEIEKRNNHQTLFVDVTPERFRVLMLEGQPFWDSKFIAQSLRRDGRLELMQVSQIATGRRETLVTRMDPDKVQFPENLNELAQYDVVILGRDIEKISGEAWLWHLPEYVKERGGKILFARGRAFDPDAISDKKLLQALQLLEPVNLKDSWQKDLMFKPTAVGMSHPVLMVADNPSTAAHLFESLRPVPYIRESEAVIGTQILAEYIENENRWPGLVTQNVGSGSTMMMLGEGTWRWRMPHGSQQGLKGVYESIWTNAVRWMLSAGDFMPGADLALQVTPRHLKMGEDVIFSVTTRVADKSLFPKGVQVTGPDGKIQFVAFPESDREGLWADLKWRPEQTGVYRVEMEAPGMEPDKFESLFNVYDANVERLQSGARPGILKMIARETGGQFLDPYKPDALGEILQTHQAMKTQNTKPESIWNQGWILFWILLLAGTEWISRRIWGWS